MYLLSQHPRVQQKLLEEIVRICGKDPTVPITAGDIANLKYLGQLLKETLRLYPPVVIINKSCIADTDLPGGYKIKANKELSIFVYGLHRNPRIW